MFLIADKILSKTKTIFIYDDINLNISKFNFNKVISENYEHEIINLSKINTFDFLNYDKNHKYDTIFIDNFKVLPTEICQSEILTLPFYILAVCIAQYFLKDIGDLYLNCGFVKYLPSLQLIYLLSNNSQKFELVINDIIVKDLGFFYFHNNIESVSVLVYVTLYKTHVLSI